MSDTTNQRTRRRSHTRSAIVKEARDARFALVRVIGQVTARRREELHSVDGDLVPEVVVLTEAERIEALQLALVWLQRAENSTRHLRVLIERQLEKERF